MSKKKHKNEEAEESQVVETTTNENPSQSDEKVNGEEQQVKDGPETKVVEIDPLEQAQSQLNEMKDKYLRLSAEFDNYRKRTQREKMDLIKYGSEDVLKSILPVVDDFERALKSLEHSTDIEAFKQGLFLIHGKFSEFLKSSGVQEIQAVGQDLDTDMHEAITKIPVQDEAQKGKIVDVIQKGYKLNDKVIRFAKVVIGE